MAEEFQRREQDRKALRGMGRLFLTPSAVLEVRMLDLSSRGVACVASANLPVNSTCTLQFSIPDEARRDWFKIAATVVAAVLSGDANGFRLSLRFDGVVAEPMRVAIEKYIAN